MKFKRGFTIIELVFAIVVIGILTAIALPRFTNIVDSANETAFKNTVKNIELAVTSNYAENILNGKNSYPTALDDCEVDSVVENCLFKDVLETGLTGVDDVESNRFRKVDSNSYYYYLSDGSYKELDYNTTNGRLK